MKKVISFSLFGNNRRHLNGAIVNAILTQNNFPDWDVVYYIWDKYSHSDLEKVIETCKVINNRIIFKEFNFSEEDNFVKSLNPKLLRFLIHDDDQYDIYWIRDIDSKLCYRSRQIIEYVLDNNEEFTFSTINDYEDYYTYFLAGNFIGHNNTLFNMKDKLKEYFEEYSDYYNLIRKSLNLNELTPDILYLIHKQILFKDSGYICGGNDKLETNIYGADEHFLQWLVNKYKEEFICFTEKKYIEELSKLGIDNREINIQRLENQDNMQKTICYYDIQLF